MKGECSCWYDYPNQNMMRSNGNWRCLNYECIRNKCGYARKTKCRILDSYIEGNIKRWEAGMLEIVFEYRDASSGWEWRRQCCIMSSVDECIKFYGLGVDCEYRIINVKEV